MGHRQKTFFRCCHICGQLTENNDEVKRCNHCGKPFAPFYFVQEQQDAQSDYSVRDKQPEGTVRSVIGLTASW